ncbi:MAG: hypothetical protein Q9227_007539 [Pyrenula ochraceoflavens]
MIVLKLTEPSQHQLTAGVYLQSMVFTSALILALVYTYAQDNRGKQAHFYIIQIPVEFLPWAMLCITLVFGGYPAALAEGMGLVAAHSYDFLTRLYPTFQGGRNWVQTPGFVARAFGSELLGRTQNELRPEEYDERTHHSEK